MELHKDEFDILAVIRFLAWGLKDLLEQKDIVFNMNIDDFASKLLTEHRVIGDKQRVVQTLGELQCISVCFTFDLHCRCVHSFNEVNMSMSLKC